MSGYFVKTTTARSIGVSSSRAHAFAMIVLCKALIFAGCDPQPPATQPVAAVKTPKAPVSYGEKATVASVADGDTLTATIDGERLKVRVIGIDCPEASRNSKCLAIERKEGLSCDEQIVAGKRATQAAKLLLGDEVWLEPRTP